MCRGSTITRAGCKWYKYGERMGRTNVHCKEGDDARVDVQYDNDVYALIRKTEKRATNSVADETIQCRRVSEGGKRVDDDNYEARRSISKGHASQRKAGETHQHSI